MGEVILEFREPSCAEKDSGNEEKRGHSKVAQVFHAEVDACETLLHMVDANEQQDESLELVYPLNPVLCCCHEAFTQSLFLEPSTLVFDGCIWSVPRENDCFSRERQKFVLNAQNKGFFVAAKEVRAAHAPSKKDVARE